jgi:hypothetical protein
MIKGDLIKIKIFRFNYTNLINFWKITEGIKNFINHGSLVSLNINTDPAIARKRIYQDYIHGCQMLLIEVPKLAEKLATYLIQKDQHWFSAHVNIDISATLNKKMNLNKNI